MRKYLLLAFLGIAINFNSLSQKHRIYLDEKMRPSTEAAAAYYEEWYEKKGMLEGPFREYYISGKIKSEYHYKDEILDSVYTAYFEGGQLQAKGEYLKGKQTGLWQEWYEDGQMKSKVSYVLFKAKDYINGGKYETSGRNGIYKVWHENGKLKVKGNFINGDEDGLWQEWHDNGQLAVKGEYKDGMNIGVWQEWYEDGQLKSKGTYEKGSKIGLWEAWHKNGQLASKGTYREFPKRRKTPHYGKWSEMPNTQKDGLWESWYEEGQKATSANYKEGDIVGIATMWHPNEQKAAEYNFEKGILVNGWDQDGTELVKGGNGYMKHYNFKNQLISKGQYSEGSKKGRWIYYFGEERNDSSIYQHEEKEELVSFEDSKDIMGGFIFQIVEESAQPNGGMSAFYRYVGTNLQYPRAGKRLGLQGKVFLSFVVDKDGSITFTEIVRSAGFCLDREAIRVIRQSSKWTPGKQRGRAVRQKMTLPVTFKLR